MNADQRPGLDSIIVSRRAFLKRLAVLGTFGTHLPLASRAEAANCVDRRECLKEFQAGFVLTGSIFRNLNNKSGFQSNEGDEYLRPAVGQRYLLYNRQNPKQYITVEIDSEGNARDSRNCEVFVFSGGADSKIKVSNGSERGALTVVARRINAFDLAKGETVRLGDPAEINSALACEAKIWNLRIDERYLVQHTLTPTPTPTFEIKPTPTLTPTPAAPPYQLPGRSHRAEINVPIPEGGKPLADIYGLVPVRDNFWYEDPLLAA